MNGSQVGQAAKPVGLLCTVLCTVHCKNPIQMHHGASTGESVLNGFHTLFACHKKHTPHGCFCGLFCFFFFVFIMDFSDSFEPIPFHGEL